MAFDFIKHHLHKGLGFSIQDYEGDQNDQIIGLSAYSKPCFIFNVQQNIAMLRLHNYFFFTFKHSENLYVQYAAKNTSHRTENHKSLISKYNKKL